jgi:hypothetical protein
VAARHTEAHEPHLPRRCPPGRTRGGDG